MFKKFLDFVNSYTEVLGENHSHVERIQKEEIG